MKLASNSVAELKAAAVSLAAQRGLHLVVCTRDEIAGQCLTTATVLIIAEPAILLVVPLSLEPQQQVARLLAFADNFEVCRPRERRWCWSAVLAAQLELILDVIAAHAPGEGSGAAALYWYLNGGFCRRDYPAGAAPIPAPTAPNSNCRAENPRLPAILRVFGAASLHNLQYGATPDRKSYYLFNSAESIVGLGRGARDRQMRLGATFEYAERWAAHVWPETAVCARHADLGAQALRPADVWGIPAAQAAATFPHFSETRTIPWLPVRSLPSGDRHFLPLDMVNYLVPVETPTTPHRNSNGCALGNAPTEAALFATLEVIERDALLLMWYSQGTPPRFHLTTVHEAAGQELLRLLALAGYAVAMFDMTTEYRVPTVLVLLSGDGAQNLASFVTAASHPNPQQAFLGALAEAQSLIATAERNYQREQATVSAAALPDGRHEAQYLYFAQPSQRHQFDFLRAVPETLAYADFVAPSADFQMSADTALEQLTARIAAVGQTVLICDNTPPALVPLGLYSARAYIPGAINLTFGANPPALPPERFRRAARHVPWVRAGDVPAVLPPHPLG
ncbi:MAG: YcaO-like family protein [Nevskia sp.]|jgi:ribosomal protein S12 methylthiotransferase accessory factor|nr:YcaO-like family protein [Nevskia sp.]